jgi:4-amino-4-deoxy-L-arabinose transferase-like glycosyltransferase
MNKLKFQVSRIKSLVPGNILLILVLFLAAFYRLFRIADYMTFLGDEGRDVLVVYNILHGHLTLLGPTSSVGGFFLGPIYYYFMAPFLFIFNYNPVGPAIGVALIGIITVWLIFYVISKFFNKTAAIIGASLYAISPVIVAYSRSSWNPNPLPLFSLLSLFLLFLAVKKDNLKLLLFVGILLGICMQLHYLAIFLGLIIFLYILFTSFYKSNFKISIQLLIKRNLSIFIGFLIGWSPFLAFEIRHGFMDFKSISNFIIHSGNTGPSTNFFAIIYDVFFRLFGRLVFNFPPPEHFWNFDKILLSVWTICILVFAVGSVCFLLYNFYNSLKRKDDNFYKYTLLVFWLFFGILLFGFYKKAIYDYYFTFLFPLPFILVSVFLSFIYENKKYVGVLSKYIALFIFIFVFILNFWGTPFKYEPNRQLNQMRTIADFVMTRTNAKPFNFALITGGNSDHAYRYFFTTWNHPPTTIEDFAHDPNRKTVTDQLFVVCESLPCEPLGNSLWEVAGFGRADIAGHWKVSVVEIYKLVHYKGK